MWSIKKLWSNGHLDISQPNGHTWDAARLEQSQRQPVFMYGTMKRRFRSYDFIKDFSQFRGVAFTANPNWSMWKKSLGDGTFPIAMRVPYSMVPQARVKGELFLIDSQRIFDLDEILLNGVEFRRKKVNILVPYCRNRRIVNADHNYEDQRLDAIYRLQAYMYVGRHDYWKDHLDAGYHFKLCTCYSPRGLILPGSYYDFTPLELND